MFKFLEMKSKEQAICITLLVIAFLIIGLMAGYSISPKADECVDYSGVFMDKCIFGCFYVDKLYTKLNHSYDETQKYVGECHSMCRDLYGKD